MVSERKEIKRILKNNYKRFSSGEFMFGIDTLQDKEDLFDKSDFRVLIVYLSSGKFRSASNTYNAVNSIIKRSNQSVFVDYCYFPSYLDKNLLSELELPYIFGNVSGAVARDYDLVLVNCSVIKEQFNLPIMLRNSEIPLSHDGRLEDDGLPLFVLGGSSANVAYGLFGDVNYKGDNGCGLVDLALFGKGEDTLPRLVNHLIDCKKNGLVNKREVIDYLFRRTLGESLFYPGAYEYEYDDALLKGVRVKDLYKNHVPYVVKYNWWCNKDIDFSEKIFNVDGSFSVQGDLVISSGCTGNGSCSFCLEGSIGGPWKEKSIEELENDMESLRINSGCESLGIFSYNSNYYSDLYTLVGRCSNYFDRISLLASRADVYAKDKEYLSLVKKLGTVRVSIASEGLSDRLRNSYLNKNLSKSDFYDAVYNIMSEGFLSLKINYILTGKENEEDFNEWVDDLTYFENVKRENGFKTQVSITITNLVIYDQTSLRYEERVMAKNSLNYESSEFIKRYMSYLDKIKSLGVKITIYGSNYITCAEQLLLDLGVRGTSVLVEASLDNDVVYERDLAKNSCLRYISLAKNTYKNVEALFDERSLKSVFYSDLIDFNTYKNKESIKDMFIARDYNKAICLGSGSRESDKCYSCGFSYCHGKRPCKNNTSRIDNNNISDSAIEDNNSNDIDIDSNVYDRDNIITESDSSERDDTNITNVIDNGERADERAYRESERVNYETLVEKESYDDVLKLIASNNISKSVLRLVINRYSEYDIVDCSVQSRLGYVGIQKLLYESKGLSIDSGKVLKLLKNERYSSLSNVVGGGLKPYYCGRFVVDFELREKLGNDVVEYINGNLDKVNTFDSFKVEKVYYYDMGEMDTNNRLNYNDYNVFIGTISHKLGDPNRVIDKINDLMGGDSVIIKSKDIRKSISLMLKNTKISRDEIKIYYDYKGKDLVLGIVCKCGVSPYLILKTLYTRMSLETIYSNSMFSLVGSFKSLKGVELSCGKCKSGNKLYFDLFRNKISSMCLGCYCKSYLYLMCRS